MLATRKSAALSRRGRPSMPEASSWRSARSATARGTQRARAPPTKQDVDACRERRRSGRVLCGVGRCRSIAFAVMTGRPKIKPSARRSTPMASTSATTSWRQSDPNHQRMAITLRTRETGIVDGAGVIGEHLATFVGLAGNPRSTSDSAPTRSAPRRPRPEPRTSPTLHLSHVSPMTKECVNR